MANKIKRDFIPFRDLSFDAGAFANDKLVVARNVIPWHGTYVPSCGPDAAVDLSGSIATASLWLGYGAFRSNAALAFLAIDTGSDTKIYTDDLTTITDVTRVGSDYVTPAFVNFAQFGATIIATMGDTDAMQYKPAGATDFANMITSTFAPRAFFAAPIRNNLFLGNIYLTGGYDSLAAGNNRETVAWSQTDNVRSFGSPTVNPELVGAGYNTLTNDGGAITGLVGGDYGIVFQERAIVRIDGPPYTFANIVQGVGCMYPQSMCRFKDDVYFWGTDGPAVLRGGLQYEPLLEGSLRRMLTEAGARPFDDWGRDAELTSATPAENPRVIVDHSAGIVGWAYRTRGVTTPETADTAVAFQVLVYNVRDQRAAVMAIAKDTATEGVQRLAFVGQETQITGDWPLVALRSYKTAVIDTDPYRQVYAVDNLQAYSGRLYSSFILLNSMGTTRVRRVRPVYRGVNLPGTYTPTATPPMFASVASLINPAAGAQETAWSNTYDQHGWCTLHDSIMADYHSFRVRFGTGATVDATLIAAQDIVEFDGIEIEWEETAGEYSR